MSTVAPAERAMNLVIALTHTPHRMTRAEIRSRVNGYADAPNDDAFERMFERDKDMLRDLGIPVVTLVNQAHGDDVGYRIDTEHYRLPAIDLTPEEIGVLSAAAQVWQGAHLDPVARRAVTKLRAISPAAADDVGARLRVPPPEATFEPLVRAATTRARVGFRYRAASSSSSGSMAPARRRVEPWRLVARDGAWYLQAWDLDREAERLFRLSRIAGSVSVSEAGSATKPVPADLHREGAPARRCVLAVRPDRAAALRLRAVVEGPEEQAPDDAASEPVPEGYERVVVLESDLEALAGMIAGYTADVLVLAPADLRAGVIARLQAAAALAVPREGGDADA